MRRCAIFGCLLGISTACGGSGSGSDTAQPSAIPGATSRTQAEAARPSPYDAEGRLKPSGRMLHWLEIPTGFENTASWAQHHVFESDQVSVEKLREYLAARMLTGQVDELGQGALYRRVMPLSADAKAMRFDIQVGVTEGGRVVRLDLDELLFPGVEPLSPEQAAEALKRDQARAE